MPTRGKTPRDEFDHHEMESRSSVDQHKNQKGGNKMKRRIEMSEIPIGIAASALAAALLFRIRNEGCQGSTDHHVGPPACLDGADRDRRQGGERESTSITTITFSLNSLLTSGPYASRSSSEKIFSPKRPS